MIQRLRSPLAIRVPLFDPDRMLNLTLPLVRPLFSIYGFIAWLLLVLTGVGFAVLHWPELTSDVSDRVLAAENVALIMCVYPIVKSLHELGHAYCGRAHDWFGGKRYKDPEDKKSKTKEGYYEDGCPLSLMHPTIVETDCFMAHYYEYVKEIFENCNPY